MNRTRISSIFLAICWMRTFFSIGIVVNGIPMMPSSDNSPAAADRHNRYNPSKGRVRQVSSPSPNPSRSRSRSPYPTRTGRPSALPSLKHSSSPSQLSHMPSHGSVSPSLRVKETAPPSQLSHIPSYNSVSPSLKQSASPSQISRMPSYRRSTSPSSKQSVSPSRFHHMPSYHRSVSPSLKHSANPTYENISNGDSLAPSIATSDVTTSSPPTPTLTISTPPPSTGPTFRAPEPMPSFQDTVTIGPRCEPMNGVLFGSSTSNSSVTIFFIYEVHYNSSNVSASASDVTSSSSSSIQTNILPSLESFMTKLLAKTVFTTGCANGRTNNIRYASASVKASLSATATATGVAMDDLQSAIVGISGWPMDRVIEDVPCQGFAGRDDIGTTNNISSSTDTMSYSYVKCRRVDGRMTIHLSREGRDQGNADVLAPTNTTTDDAKADIDTRRTSDIYHSRRLSNTNTNENENDLLGENVANYTLSIIKSLMLKGEMDHAHEDIIRVNFINVKGQVISGRDGNPTNNGSTDRNQDIGFNKEDGFSTYEKVLLGTACGVAIIVLFFGWGCRKQYLAEKNIGDDAMHQIDSQDTDDDGTDDAPFETSQRLDFTMLCLDETTEAEVLSEVEKELGLNSNFDNVEKEVEGNGVSVSVSGGDDYDGIIGIERVRTIDDLLNVGLHETIAGAADDTSSSQDNDECETVNFE